MLSSQLRISQCLFGRYWHFPSKRLPALWKSRLVLHALLFWSLFTDLQRCLGQRVCGGHGKSSACSASVGFSYPLMKAIFFSLSAFFHRWRYVCLRILFLTLPVKRSQCNNGWAILMSKSQCSRKNLWLFLLKSVFFFLHTVWTWVQRSTVFIFPEVLMRLSGDPNSAWFFRTSIPCFDLYRSFNCLFIKLFPNYIPENLFSASPLDCWSCLKSRNITKAMKLVTIHLWYWWLNTF